MLSESSGPNCATSPRVPVLEGISEDVPPEDTAIGFDKSNNANLMSPVVKSGSTTDAARESLDGIKGICWYDLGSDPSGCVSIFTPSDENMILSLGDVRQDEHGVIQGISVRTLQGDIVVEPKTIENLLVALVDFKRILRYTSGAPYDFLWMKYVLELRDDLPHDQYQKFCKLFGSPNMVLSLLGLHNRELLPPKGSKTRAPFTYSPLSSGEIRLIIVLPSLDATTPVECVLCHDSLEQPPSYEALSYVWGEASKTRLIKVNEQDFEATENLELALRTLRYSTPGKFRVLWVDAICIDQNNIDERNEQVRQMHKVYSSAQLVCVWLGKETNTDRLAIEFLHQLPALLLGPLIKEFNNDSNWPEIVDLESAQKVVQNPALFQKWEALFKFFTRPWWTRVWVLQEVLLAQKASLYCGRLAVDWEVIRANCTIIATNATWLNSIVGHPDTNRIVRMVWRSLHYALAIEDMRFAESYSDSSKRLLKLLREARTSEATDPRDHVYGVMGLFRPEKLIIPDYRLSVTETFTRTAMFHMETSRTLDILSHVMHSSPGPKRLLCLPSWVPDWSFRPNELWFGYFALTEDGTFYSACLARESPLPFLFFNKYLREVGLHGFMVDRIEKTERPSYEDKLNNIVQDWRLSISESVDQPYFGLHSTLEAFWRTVFGDILVDREFIGRLGSHIGPIARLPPSDEEERLLFSFLALDACPAGMTCFKKRFFRTRTGRIGLGSVDIKPGDIVVVLLGGCVPFILREAFDGRYFLVCDSYVHGIMDGEIVKEWNDSKRDVELFTLV